MTDDTRARMKYARSLKANARVKYRAGGEVVEGRFIARVKDPVGVAVSTGRARKYVELETLVLPATVAPAAKKKAKSVRQLPAGLRRHLGIS
jgi:hypothetical protein